MLALALLTLIGCATSCEDIEGAVCADDLAALEAAGAAYAWFDQDGVQVTEGAELVWFDDEGVLWQVDPDAGVPDGRPTSYDLAGIVFHLAADCSDPGMYGGLPSPKVAFYNGEAREDYPVLVRDASADEVDAVAAAYLTTAGDCREAEVPREQHLVPVAAVRELARPDVVWVAPLYPAPL